MGQTSDLVSFDKRNKLNAEFTAKDFDKRLDVPKRLPKLNLTRVASPQVYNSSNEHLKQLLSLQTSFRERNNSTSSKESSSNLF